MRSTNAATRSGERTHTATSSSSQTQAMVRKVGCGFDAVAEDREPPRIGTRERVGRDGGCGTGPDGCHLFGVRERDGLSITGCEQRNSTPW